MGAMGQAIYIHPSEARRQFELLAGTDIPLEALARGALLIALEEYPKLKLEEYLAQLDEIADRVRERITRGEPDIFKLGHVHAELFDRRGFIGNIASYYDPRNSYLNEVLDRRIGIPITLSILFIDIARKVGLDAVGVGVPGHYLVKMRFELSEVYVDPFHGGRTLTVREIGEFINEISGGNVKLRSEHLRAWTARETLTRVLANLQNIYQQNHDTKRANAARERIGMLMKK